MENNNSKYYKISSDEELLIHELPEGILQKIIDSYEKARSYEGYMQVIATIVLVGGVLIHNVFIAGNSYHQDTFDSIMHTEFGIIGVTIILIIIMWALSAGDDREAKEILEESARKNSINKRKLKEEVNSILIQLCGGTGLK